MADRPDERALLAELASPRFKLGEALGHWRLVSAQCPIVILEVLASDQRKFAFRFECTGYPAKCPDAVIWDPENSAPLATNARPVMLDPYQLVFRSDWENGTHLYHPMERHAFATHNGWSNELRDMLNGSAYQPSQADAA